MSGKVKDACDDYMEFIRGSDYHEDKLDNYTNAIFEAAMEESLGTGIFEEVNAAIDDQEK